jgi:succinoglycan biosynthesis transport protein ExoP
MDIKPANYSEIPQLPPTQVRQGFFSKIDVLRSVRLHALTATLVTLLALGLVLAVLIQHRPTYAATSVVYVSPTFPATLATDSEHEHAFAYESYIAEQMHSVTRYDVLADAIHQLKPGTWQKPGESDELAVERLQHGLDVSREGLSYQMEITLTGTHPEELAQIVNAVTNSYLQKMRGEEFYGRDERLASLKSARDQVQKELNTDLQEQARISQELGVAVIGSGDSDQLDSQTAKLRADLLSAHEQRVQAQAQLSALEIGGSPANSPALEAAADEIIAGDPGLVALKTSLSQKRALLLEQLAGMTANHPLRKSTEEQLAQTEAGLQTLQNRLRSQAAAHLEQKLHTELKRARTVEAQLSSDLENGTHKATTAASKFQRAEELKNQIAALQARYAQLDERERNLELESGSPGSEHMFSPARTPIEPMKSKIRKYGPLLLPLCLVLGVGSVVLIDLLDPRVYAPTDIEQVLGFSPIGTIFDDREVTLQAFDECCLRLAAGIDQAARKANVRTIVLTGVHTGAGTSSITENLGSTLAKIGRKTLTIDASGRLAPVAYLTIGHARAASKPETHSASAKGTASTGLQSAAVLAQPISPQLAPLNSFMDQAFKDLTNEYDLVLIDATPLLISAETEYLARFADVTVLISEAGKTRKAQLLRASRVLERLRARGIAAVINKVNLMRAPKAMRDDLEQFETHVNRMNLRWRPAGQTADISTPDFVGADKSAASENASYA